jgi:UDP-glucuronate decarboxylase
MKLLVTGGTGFVGRSLLDYAAKLLRDHDASRLMVTVLSRNPERFLNKFPRFSGYEWLSVRYADVLKPETLPRCEAFSHVIHAATEAALSGGMSQLNQFIQIVDGTRNILDLAVATGASRVLLTSSGAIYGPQPVDLNAFPEDWPGSPPLAEPSSGYGQAKRAAEHLCALYAQQHGFEAVVARCFSFVGPDLPLDVHYAIGNFIRDAMTADDITVVGDGTPLRTYLDQTDLAHWLFTLLIEGRPGQAYNVGSDEVICIADLAILVRNILAPQKSVKILGHQTFGSPRNRYVPDIRRARLELGLDVTVPLADAIRRAVEA